MNSEAKKILVYIAHPTVLEVTVFRLELLGMRTTGVSSSDEMTEALAEGLPDAVLIDLDLETGEGIRWVEKIASDECTSHIPIICISSRGDLVEVENAYKAGAKSFVISPYDPVVLESKLVALLNLVSEPIATLRDPAERT
ncbi:response regulator [Planctomycetes bacterium TBK1r]|uniref:Phosphate regulon transcriptional regulatory protein PhoB n=1 Tax=Stieleria magnilauensis TaxID=2527963 RepID=A0ABX5XHK5_9BACT|nr:Phosphate regulon transcriptional regulatory protein PhoB [Planctomycetes bacterium TBK1r]